MQAGQRWSLTVRLKRPHGNANFGARDAEAALLARDIRATGYVTAASSARRLARDAFGITLAIDRWRAHLRDRIERVLGDAPHRGIVVALAVGAQDGVSDDDWSLMRATGTSHLVAISGLHIGFVAGLAGWLTGFVWRRARWRGVPLPLCVSAPKVSAAGAAVFAALLRGLAGFQCARAARIVDARVSSRSRWSAGDGSRRRWCWRGRLRWCLSPIPGRSRRPGSGCRSARSAAILYAMAGYGRRASKWRDWRDAGGEPHADPVPYDSTVRVREPVPKSVDRLRAIFHRKARRLHGHLASSGRVQYAVTISLAPLTAYWFSQIPLIGPLANAIAIPWVSLLVTPTVLAGVAAARAARRLRLSGRARPARPHVRRACSGLSGPAWALWRLPQPDALALAAAAVGVAWALAPRGWPLRFAAPLTWLPLVLPAPNAPPHRARSV